MPSRITHCLRTRAGSSVRLNAAGTSTNAHTLNSNPTSPSGRSSVRVRYSGRATEPKSIAVWNSVKLAAATSNGRVKRVPASPAAGRGGAAGVAPSSSNGPGRVLGVDLVLGPGIQIRRRGLEQRLAGGRHREVLIQLLGLVL